MLISRTWAMPNANTFDVKPIGDFVRKYLAIAKISVDPFARNKTWATYTNDLNPNTHAQQHLDAEVFLHNLAIEGIRADLLILDPPYSPRQMKEMYNSFGRKMQQKDALMGAAWKKWREAALPLLTKDATILTFGWNSVGMGKKAGFEIEEILLVCHGSDHNDTICVAERRVDENQR